MCRHHMCPLKLLPLDYGGWVGVGLQFDGSSRGVDPTPRGGDASSGLLLDVSATPRSAARVASPSPPEVRRAGQSTDRTRRVATPGSWGAMAPPFGALPPETGGSACCECGRGGRQ